MEKTYLVGATAYSGTSGGKYYPVFNVNATDNTLEAFLFNNSYTVAAFIDFRYPNPQQQNPDSWARSHQYLWGNVYSVGYDNYNQTIGNISNVFDGLIFYNQQIGTTPISTLPHDCC
jgi:hypothetical protein